MRVLRNSATFRVRWRKFLFSQGAEWWRWRGLRECGSIGVWGYKGTTFLKENKETVSARVQSEKIEATLNIYNKENLIREWVGRCWEAKQGVKLPSAGSHLSPGLEGQRGILVWFWHSWPLWRPIFVHGRAKPDRVLSVSSSFYTVDHLVCFWSLRTREMKSKRGTDVFTLTQGLVADQEPELKSPSSTPSSNLPISLSKRPWAKWQIDNGLGIFYLFIYLSISLFLTILSCDMCYMIPLCCFISIQSVSYLYGTNA